MSTYHNGETNNISTNEATTSPHDGILGRSEFAEQQPTYRRAMFRQHAGSLRQSVPNLNTDVQSFMTAPPKPAMIKRNLNFRRSVPNLKLNLDESYTNWDVISGRSLPAYPLGRTELINLPPSQVAKNIAEALRLKSVHAIYDSLDAEATCTTACDCKFKITLFAAEDSSHTILEVLKSRGCSLTFSRLRRAISRAANGDFSLDEQPLCLSIPDCVAALYTPPNVDDIKKILAKSSKELQTTRRDGQLTTLRLLAAMTDADKSHKSTCINVATMILEGEAGVRETCINLLSSDTSDEYSERVNKAVLDVFSNSLGLLYKSGDIRKVTESEDPWYAQSLFPSLLQSMKQFSCPHGCTLVSQCLSVLLQNSSDMRHEAVKEGSLETILERVLARGKKSHVKLYDNAQSAINALHCQ